MRIGMLIRRTQIAWNIDPPPPSPDIMHRNKEAQNNSSASKSETSPRTPKRTRIFGGYLLAFRCWFRSESWVVNGRNILVWIVVGGVIIGASRPLYGNSCLGICTFHQWYRWWASSTSSESFRLLWCFDVTINIGTLLVIKKKIERDIPVAQNHWTSKGGMGKKRKRRFCYPNHSLAPLVESGE